MSDNKNASPADAGKEGAMKRTHGTPTTGPADEEDTLPPLVYPERPPDVSRQPRTGASGDYKFAQTIVGARHFDDGFDLLLIAKLGWQAYLRVDEEIAARLALELKRQLKASYPHLFVSRPPELPIMPLSEGDPPVRFAAGDDPELRVAQETDGDRIALTMVSKDALVIITLDAGVAITLLDILTDFAPDETITLDQ